MSARRAYRTGQLYAKHGAWYGRWRTSGGRRLNRRVGSARSVGEADGLTRREAERQFRRMQDEEERRAARPGSSVPLRAGAAPRTIFGGWNDARDVWHFRRCAAWSAIATIS